MIEIDDILNKKTELLCKGVLLDKSLMDSSSIRGGGISLGRRGGAGPLGGRYFLFEDDKTLVNIHLWPDQQINSNRTNLILKKVNDHFEIYDKIKNEFFSRLKLINFPDFYNLKTSDGILMKKIALSHGKDCLASTIYQKCKYWACGEACKFCGIELSLNSDATVLEKNYEQISEVITAAKIEGRCKHMTLTSGTMVEDEELINRYVAILEGLKKDHSDISLHVQIEPIENLENINKLKEAGADTIGIHIEILDEILRKMITPGKAKIPYQLFEDNWLHALDIFGKNQVETFLLCGFGENCKEFMRNLERVISLGIITYIVPVRSIPDNKFNFPLMNYKFFLEIYKRTAEMMYEYGVNPLENNAGCVRCGGCSAIIEAYEAV